MGHFVTFALTSKHSARFPPMASSGLASIIRDEKNPRGIPKALFIVSMSRGSIYFQFFLCEKTFCRAMWSSTSVVQMPKLKRSRTHFKMRLRMYEGPSTVRFCLPGRTNLRKYRYMDSNLNQRRRSLEDKIPDIKKTLTMVEYLQDRRVRIPFWRHSFATNV